MCFWSFGEIITVVLNVYSNELIVNPLRKYVINLFFICITFGGLLGHFLTHYTNSYKLLMSVIFFGYLFGVLMLALFLPESPNFLLKKGKNPELRGVIRQMAEVNRIDEQNLKIALEDLEQIIECYILFYTLPYI
jgi:hypothetical protein